VTDEYALIKILNGEHGVFRLKVVANMVREGREGQEVCSKLSKVTGRFLDVALELVGTVPFDENIRKAVSKQTAIVDAYPGSPASRSNNTVGE
jgi:ATPases involved in chromosome partitioning